MADFIFMKFLKRLICSWSISSRLITPASCIGNRQYSNLARIKQLNIFSFMKGAKQETLFLMVFISLDTTSMFDCLMSRELRLIFTPRYLYFETTGIQSVLQSWMFYELFSDVDKIPHFAKFIGMSLSSRFNFYKIISNSVIL